MGGARPKQFMLLGGIPILARTINNFAAALPGAEIVVVLPAEHTGFCTICRRVSKWRRTRSPKGAGSGSTR